MEKFAFAPETGNICIGVAGIVTTGGLQKCDEPAHWIIR